MTDRNPNETLKKIRLSLGLSQAELKSLLNDRLVRNYDRHTISRWENGRQPIPADVLNELKQIDERRPQPLQVIVFANQKGGVGKTTSALNVAYALNRLNYRVLLIDADPQASATSALVGDTLVELYRSSKTLDAALLKGTPFSDVILDKSSDLGNGRTLPFAFIPSHIDLAEVDVRREPGTEGLLREAVQGIQSDFDYIIIDSPPHLGFLTWMALTAANLVFIPVRTEPYDVMGVNLILDTISKVNRRSNPRLRIGGVIPTQYSSSQYVDVGIIEHLITSLSGKADVLEPVPSSTAFSNAAWEGKISVELTPTNPAVRPYVRLAEAISTGNQPLLAVDVLEINKTEENVRG
ncbi:AAA family ATPase [Acetobacter aceti]|uniref:AAA family ATPase n=1 Tax=Acetobacter aceti TaxID=435 RepID=UPI000C081E96|nr:AAA family ATPase [Acetobacter aceti]